MQNSIEQRSGVADPAPIPRKQRPHCRVSSKGSNFHDKCISGGLVNPRQRLRNS